MSSRGPASYGHDQDLHRREHVPRRVHRRPRRERLRPASSSGTATARSVDRDRVPRPDDALRPPAPTYLREVIETAGALVVGRHLFNITNGWEGRHPIDIPVVVVTHEPPTDWQPRRDPFVFVTEGVEAAVARARELAGDKAVVVNGGTDGQAGARGGPDRRALGRPRPGPARRRHAVLRSRRGPVDARGPALGRRGRPRHPPALRRR